MTDFSSLSRLCLRRLAVAARVVLLAILGSMAFAMKPADAETLPRLEKVRVLENGPRDNPSYAYAGHYWGVTWSSDGHLIAAHHWGGQINIWSATGTRLWDFRQRPRYHNVILFVPGTHELLTHARPDAPSQTVFTVWDADTGTALRDIPGPAPEKSQQFNSAMQSTLSGDGRILGFTTGQLDEPVTFYALPDWRITKRIPIGPSPTSCSSLALSVDGDQLVVGCAGGDIFLFDLRKPDAPPRKLEVYPPIPMVYAKIFAFSPDGRLLAIGVSINNPKNVDLGSTEQSKADAERENAPIKVVRLEDDAVIAAYPVQDFTAPYQFSWSPDGRYLAVVVRGTLRVVTPQEPERPELAVPLKHFAHSVSFSPNGRELAVANEDTIEIFALRE